MRRTALAATLLLGACTFTSDAPLVLRDPTLDPIEGVEQPGLVERAHAAVLVARGERPIEILLLPERKWRSHGVAGDVTALAGPDRKGAFVYAIVREAADRRGVLRRTDIGNAADVHLAQFDRRIEALALSADGARVAVVLEPGKSTARELAIVDVDGSAVTTVANDSARAAPTWLDDGRLAFLDALGNVVVFDPASGGRTSIAARANLVRAAPGAQQLLTASRDADGVMQLARVPLDGGPAEALVVRGVVAPLALLERDLLVALAAPTLGAEAQWELEIPAGRRALATIKLFDLATGAFVTVESRASLTKAWSAGALDPR